MSRSFSTYEGVPGPSGLGSAAGPSSPSRPVRRRLRENLNRDQILSVLAESDSVTSDSDSDISAISELSVQDIADRSDSSDNEDDDSSSVGSEVDAELQAASSGNLDNDDGGNVQGATLDTFVWDENDFIPNQHIFDPRQSGASNQWDVPEDAPELQYFEKFLDDDILDFIVQETNRYHEYLMREFGHKLKPRSRLLSWEDVDKTEIRTFLALVMLMAHIIKPQLDEYWKSDPLTDTPVFRKYMTRDRFQNILRCLHFADNDYPSDVDRIWKIRQPIDMITSNFSKYFNPFQKVVIDESLILFKGRLAFKQYIPSKRHRFGIKLFVLCDCETGYVIDMMVYQASNFEIPRDDPHGVSGAVVKKLMGKFLNKDHILITDNWYTSPYLARYLESMKTGTFGTVRKNRKKMPKLNPRLPRGEVERKQSTDMLVLNWKDKRDVTMLTTVHTGVMAPTAKEDRENPGHYIEKPDVVIDYNENMSLVDKSDMMIGMIESTRKTVRWYSKLFFHLVDVCVLNAYNMWLIRTGERMKLRNFSYKLVYQMLQKYGQIQSTIKGRKLVEVPDRLQASAYISRHHLQNMEDPSGKRKSKQLACGVCKKTTTRPKMTRKTSTWCPECNMPMCMSCFPDYHSKKDF